MYQLARQRRAHEMATCRSRLLPNAAAPNADGRQIQLQERRTVCVEGRRVYRSSSRGISFGRETIMNLNINLRGRFFSIACTFAVLTGLPGTIGSSSAAPIVALETSALPPILALTVGFQGVIPTAANPITGVERLAKMRREGRLPDTFVRGDCTYNLAGDPGVAYYEKTCRSAATDTAKQRIAITEAECRKLNKGKSKAAKEALENCLSNAD
jgi:hypothetical protein